MIDPALLADFPPLEKLDAAAARRIAEGAREGVSRQLKEFERRGWLKLTRGQIDILDRGALSQLAIAG